MYIAQQHMITKTMALESVNLLLPKPRSIIGISHTVHHKQRKTFGINLELLFDLV